MPEPRVLIGAADIQRKVQEIAKRIEEDLNGEPVILLAILKGSFPFVSDLCREMRGEVTIDFMRISSYGDSHESSGSVRVVTDHDASITGKNVVIVEDIIDTGLTLSHLLKLLGSRSPKSLRTAALLTKPEARRHQCQIDYVGFEIEDRYVVGYGLDSAERYRNLPYVAVLD